MLVVCVHVFIFLYKCFLVLYLVQKGQYQQYISTKTFVSRNVSSLCHVHRTFRSCSPWGLASTTTKRLISNVSRSPFDLSGVRGVRNIQQSLSGARGVRNIPQSLSGVRGVRNIPHSKSGMDHKSHWLRIKAKFKALDHSMTSPHTSTRCH